MVVFGDVWKGRNSVPLYRVYFTDKMVCESNNRQRYFRIESELSTTIFKSFLSLRYEWLVKGSRPTRNVRAKLTSTAMVVLLNSLVLVGRAACGVGCVGRCELRTTGRRKKD